ncbi:hypothetical protein ACFPER_05050 [Agromyces aurantiacus]|uniref:Uncharacterized protein n=1 Tax=Agromyces aurantiacus TaxID=165814 RepID=A0ABV9R758_9MICO|nr:hypothetical protein [Agromyces aurantiacus]MBM7502827.1 hypothetical protein [Agromyces aurantiacus]
MDAPTAITRSWPMLGALGAGLLLAALAAGAGGAPQAALAGLGVAALGWGVLSLRAGRMLAPRAVLGVAVATLVGGGGAVGAGALADVAGLPLAAAAVFVGAIALSAALAVRSRRAAPAHPEAHAAARPSPADARRTLLGLAVGAVLVSTLATPALAATEAGELAVPHGEHGTAPHDGAADHDPGHAH